MLTAWLLGSFTALFAIINVLFQRRRSKRKIEDVDVDVMQSELRFKVVVNAVCFAGPFYVLLSKGEYRTIFATLVSLLTTFFSFLSAHPRLEHSTNKRFAILSLAARTCLMVSLSSSLAAFFFATNSVISTYSPTLRDPTLLATDEFLMGWAFPRGQLSLWLDKDPILGPQTVFGSVLIDFLTLWYISYYIWAYLILLVLLIRCLWTERRSGPISEAIAWKITERFMCSWIISFCFTFVLNTICPAVSPRVYLRGEFKNELNGFGLRNLIGGIIHQDDTFGSFPSGHVGETLAVGIAALRLGIGETNKATKRLGKFVIFASFVVALATLWLRYHYFTDVFAAVFVSLISVACGGCFGNLSNLTLTKQQITQQQQLLSKLTTNPTIQQQQQQHIQQQTIIQINGIGVDEKNNKKKSEDINDESDENFSGRSSPVSNEPFENTNINNTTSVYISVKSLSSRLPSPR